MPRPVKFISIVALCLFLFICTASCDKEQKVGTLKITESEFMLEQDSQKTTISLNAMGKIKNTSPYDIKRIVITGRCKTCTEVMHAGEWFVTQEVKRESQKDTISYLAAGLEEPFRFDGIAYFFRSRPGEIPETYPEDLEIYVESFETVQE